MGKIRNNCERRMLRGCAGCPALHGICDKQKVKSLKKDYNDHRSLVLANEQKEMFFEGRI